MRRITAFALCTALLFEIGCSSPTAVAPPVSSERDRPASRAANAGEVVSLRNLNDLEASVLARLHPQATPDEIFIFETDFPGGGHGHAIEIAVTGQSAELKWIEKTSLVEYRSDRYYARDLSTRELAELRDFISLNHVDTLPTLEHQAFDGIEYCFFHATRSADHRLVINNPDEATGVYFQLVKLFEKLANPAKLKAHYVRHDFPKDAEVLYANPALAVYAVWAQGADIRVLAAEYGMTGGVWRAFANGKIGDGVDTPPGNPDFDLDHAEVIAGERPLDQVVTPDHRWVVGRLNGKLICYDLDNHRFTPLAENVAEHFHAGAYVIAHGKFLLVSWRTSSRGFEPSQEKYLLLDPATGTTTEVRPSYPPFFSRRHQRPFQPATQPNIVWIASNDLPFSTYLGRFDMKQFRFWNWFEIPGLFVDSDAVWVDESTARIYIVNDGHLLRLPLWKKVYENMDESWKFGK